MKPLPAASTSESFSIRPMSLREFAEAAGVSVRHLQRLVKTGELAVNRLGRRVIVPATEVERCLASPTPATTQ